MGLSSIKSNLPSPQASTDENHETPFSLARQQPPVQRFVPEGLQFRSRASIVRTHIRSGESEATPKSAASLDDRVVRRRAGPKACASPRLVSLAFANTLCLKVQMHRNLELNGQTKKIDTENSERSMAATATMEMTWRKN